MPWLWLRLIAAGFLLFCVSVLAYCLDRGAVNYMTAMVFGALMVNIPVLVFFYELNPFRNISLLTLILLVICGGALSGAVITFGYEYIYDGLGDSPWLSMLWTGFWEELVKGVVAIIAVLILKKKSPLACFLVGFAVGTGYSIFEDLGYIFAYSRSSSTTVTWVVLMSLGRSLSCGVSHAPWTGAIVWAFAKFKRPFLNWRFYGVAVSSMVLHYLADVPFFADEVAFLTGFNWGWLIEAVVVGAIFALLVFIWRDGFKELPARFAVEESGDLPKSLKLSHAGNVVAVACAALFGAFTLAGCAQSTGSFNDYATFTDRESFVGFAEGGREFDCDWGRAYDPEKDDYSQYMLEERLLGAVQKVTAGKYDYYYVYTFSEEEGARLESVGVQVGDRIYYSAVLMIFEDFCIFDRREPMYFDPVPVPPEEVEDDAGDDDGEVGEPVVPSEVVQFFLLRGIRADYDGGEYRLLTGVKQKDNTAAYIAFGALAGATALGGVIAVVVLKTKARRKRDE